MKSERIYVASSWRNALQPAVVATLRAAGLEVYDFRNPAEGDHGFHWSEVAGDNWAESRPAEYLGYINDPIAIDGFDKDMAAMEWADTFVLVLPCGRSAHLELGWAVGAGKRTAILLSDDGFEPELMYLMVDHMALSVFGLMGWLGVED